MIIRKDKQEERMHRIQISGERLSAGFFSVRKLPSIIHFLAGQAREFVPPFLKLDLLLKTFNRYRILGVVANYDA